MTVKEKFLSIKTYEEFDSKREEFKDLDTTDAEVLKHFEEISPTVDNSDFENGIIVDVHKNKR